MIEQRNKIANEILATEATYCSNLRVIMKVFISPLRERAKGESLILQPGEITTIFGNVELIYNLNIELLSQLRVEFTTTISLVTLPGPYGSLGPRTMSWRCFFKACPLLQNIRRVSCRLCSWSARVEAIENAKLCFYGITHELILRLKCAQEFLTNALSKPECNRLDLSSFMIMPVQRIPRYELLIGNLVKHTWADHADFVNLCKVTKAPRNILIAN